MEPGVIHYGGRGAVVVGEIDGRMTPRVDEIRDAWLDFDSRAISTSNIWGYLWGKEAYGATPRASSDPGATTMTVGDLTPNASLTRTRLSFVRWRVTPWRGESNTRRAPAVAYGGCGMNCGITASIFASN